MIHVRHAAAAIASGLCETVLITNGENGPLYQPDRAAEAHGDRPVSLRFVARDCDGDASLVILLQ
jgi:hypothetical protein